MVKKILFTSLLLWFALIIFMPKEELYFGLERALAKQGIEINEGMIEEGMFGLVLKDVSLYAEGVKVATAKRISLFTLLAYSKIKIEEFQTDSGLRSILSVHLKKTVLYHSLLNPVNVYFKSIGDTGEIEGYLSLREHKAYFTFSDEKKSKPLKKFLKKDKKGWYYGF
jgi:hypothetical protein